MEPSFRLTDLTRAVRTLITDVTVDMPWIWLRVLDPTEPRVYPVDSGVQYHAPADVVCICSEDG